MRSETSQGGGAASHLYSSTHYHNTDAKAYTPLLLSQKLQNIIIVLVNSVKLKKLNRGYDQAPTGLQYQNMTSMMPHPFPMAAPKICLKYRAMISKNTQL